jgi:xylulokinase
VTQADTMAGGSAGRTLVAGVDSSTQSCKVVVRDAETGELVRRGSAPHPDGTEVDPAAWVRALDQALAAAGGLADVSALSIAAQQHGMVCLDESGQVVRPALLWNDTRSAGAAAGLVAESGDGSAGSAGSDGDNSRGGQTFWAEAMGSVPVASFTVAKLRWLADHEPEHAARTAAVCLPHDWLTWRLLGPAAGNRISDLTTDRSDASGTGYWSPAAGTYRLDLLQQALGQTPAVPRVLAPQESAGLLGAGTRGPDGFTALADLPSAGLVLGAGAGDNAAAALGLGARPGDVVVSLGTSGTVFAVCDTATADPSGAVAGFADATGRYLPLVCTLNAARVLDAAAALLGVDLEELSRLALSAPPGADGLTVIPYLEGERTPDRPDATGAVHGLRLATCTPAHLARAAVEGMLCGLADGLDALAAQGVPIGRIRLIGGGARSEAVRRIAPAVLGRPVVVPPPGEYVADGAAVQAAWALRQAQAGPGSVAGDPPDWAASATALGGPTMEYEADPLPWLRDRYRTLSELTARRAVLGI